jgi:hypothetical protein
VLIVGAGVNFGLDVYGGGGGSSSSSSSTYISGLRGASAAVKKQGKRRVKVKLSLCLTH